jgi:RNA polymerase sigma factor (sigma-70 family)
MANTAWPAVIRRLYRSAVPTDGPGSDADLLARFVARRDALAFGELVRRFGPLVFGVCRRVLKNDHDAEDAFQATFIALAVQAGRIGRGHALAGWLHTAAFRVALRAKSRRRFTAPADESLPDSAPEPADDLADGEWRELLDDEVRRLPEKYRLPVVLCYLQGHSNSEAAAALGCPRGTVDSRLAWARERLRHRLTRRGVTVPALWPAVGLSAAVAPHLGEAAVQSSLAWITTPAGAVSGPAAALAQGVLHDMYLLKLKLLAALAVGVATLGTGLGVAALAAGDDNQKPGSASAAGKPTPPAVVEKPPQLPAGAGEGGPSQPPILAEGGPGPVAGPGEGTIAKPAPQVLFATLGSLKRRHDEIRQALSSTIDPGVQLDGATLLSVLEFISDRTEVPIVIDETAFQREGVNPDIGQQPVKLKFHKNMTTDQVLRGVLDCISSTYVIRSGRIVILPVVTATSLQQLISLDAHDEAFDDVLLKLTLTTGANIVLDPKCQEKGRVRITIRLQNAQLQSVVEVLADMAELNVVAMDNILYLTGKNSRLQGGPPGGAPMIGGPGMPGDRGTPGNAGGGRPSGTLGPGGRPGGGS